MSPKPFFFLDGSKFFDVVLQTFQGEEILLCLDGISANDDVATDDCGHVVVLNTPDWRISASVFTDLCPEEGLEVDG